MQMDPPNREAHQTLSPWSGLMHSHEAFFPLLLHLLPSGCFLLSVSYRINQLSRSFSHRRILWEAESKLQHSGLGAWSARKVKMRAWALVRSASWQRRSAGTPARVA